PGKFRTCCCCSRCIAEFPLPMKRIVSLPKCSAKKNVDSLRRWFGQQVRNGPSADVINARVVDAFALYLDEHRRGEVTAVEGAEHHCKVGTLAVPGRLEIRAERDLGGPLRAADLDGPAPARGRFKTHHVQLHP